MEKYKNKYLLLTVCHVTRVFFFFFLAYFRKNLPCQRLFPCRRSQSVEASVRRDSLRYDFNPSFENALSGV